MEKGVVLLQFFLISIFALMTVASYVGAWIVIALLVHNLFGGFWWTLVVVAAVLQTVHYIKEF